MGRDSTESGEDSDLLYNAQPNSFDKPNAAVRVEENDDSDKRYPCLYPNCSASFRQLSRYTAHQNTHEGMRPFICDEQGCDKAYSSFPHVSRHVKTHHNKELVYQDYMKKLYKIEKSDKTYKCTYDNCNASFTRPHKLRAHERTHTNERPYICSVEGCLKSYTNPSHLKRHVHTVHSQKPVSVTYKCTFEGCEHLFKTNQALKKHYKRKHEDLEYKCTECNAMFRKHRQLKLHLFQHSGAPTLGFSCEKCEKKFETEYQLKRHRERHKTYHCSVENCTEGPFPLWTLYRKHMVLKHRPDFVCDICQQTFPFMFRLHMHKESHHNTPVVNRWPCSYPDCTHTFKEKRNMYQHIRHVHDGVRFKCPIEDCDKTFYWKASLDRHIRLHTASRPLPRPRKKPRKRKDCGKPKKSVTTKLTDVIVPIEIEKHLLSKEVLDSEEDILINESGEITTCNILQKNTFSELESESEVSDATKASDTGRVSDANEEIKLPYCESKTESK